MELVLRDSFLIEVPFADDEEVASGVVVRVGVACEFRCPQLEEVAVAGIDIAYHVGVEPAGGAGDG